MEASEEKVPRTYPEMNSPIAFKALQVGIKQGVIYSVFVFIKENFLMLR